MAAAFRIDTLKFAKRLTDAGLTREAAEVIVEGLNEADFSELAIRADLAELKADINGLRGELASEVGGLRGQLGTEASGLRGELRTAVAELRVDLYRGLWVTGLGIVGLTVALIKFLP